jgi:hypothetical protein
MNGGIKHNMDRRSVDNDNCSSDNAVSNIIIIEEKTSERGTSRDRNIETTGIPEDISLNTTYRKVSDDVSRTHSKLREDSILLEAKENMDMFNDPDIHKYILS